tara:strand:- start:864 stop:1070 length:207 start_codon:yes stop_codon:yes gene_type:complete
MESKITITESEKEMFDYLNSLRESGAINMFGARPYLAEQFALDKRKSSDILQKWMKNFNENGYEHLLA